MTLPTPYYDRDGVTIHHGDVLDVLRQLPDGIIQTCVTSPPYWGLRTYQVEGQLGLEPTPEEYIAKMVERFREVRRLLRDDGTCWINLGDAFDSKQLLGMPWRVALALQSDGWYLRSDIIWAKPNPMPESCTDRPTKSHEYIFLLSKSARYYYDADAVREASTTEPTGVKVPPPNKGNVVPRNVGQNKAAHMTNDGWMPNAWNNPAGRNKRTVWTVATESFSGAHFATYPRKLIEPCILAGATDKACAECGKPWRRVVEAKGGTIGKSWHPHEDDVGAGMSQVPMRVGSVENEDGFYRRETKGFLPDCTCGTTETRPSIVLDPFMGSGTTAEVARKHGCHVIGIELNAEYIDLAAKRLAQGVLEF